MTSQIIHFNEGDVEVCELNKNDWRAWKHCATYPCGIGSTMLEAIVDLNEKLKEER